MRPGSQVQSTTLLQYYCKEWYLLWCTSMEVLTCRCILRDGLISHAHHSPVCGETHCREEDVRMATTYHSIVTGAWRIVFTSTANRAPDHPSVLPTTVQGSTSWANGTPWAWFCTLQQCRREADWLHWRTDFPTDDECPWGRQKAQCAIFQTALHIVSHSLNFFSRSSWKPRAFYICESCWAFAQSLSFAGRIPSSASFEDHSWSARHHQKNNHVGRNTLTSVRKIYASSRRLFSAHFPTRCSKSLRYPISVQGHPAAHLTSAKTKPPSLVRICSTTPYHCPSSPASSGFGS